MTKRGFRIIRVANYEIQEVRKINRKSDAKSHPKWLQIQLWASMGPIFEILEGFDRGPIFDDF